MEASTSDQLSEPIQPEVPQPPQVEATPVPQNTERKWSAKDILAAKDAQEVMTAYTQAKKDRWADVGGLQLTVGERFVQLGDIENGMKFTLLGEQTRNTEAFGKMVEYFSESAGRVNEGSRRFEETGDKMMEVARGIHGSAESMQYTVGSLSSATDRFSRSVGELNNGVSSIDNAAGRIESASRNMGGSRY